MQNRTVFILGAGASAEVSMPLGSELATQIAAAVNMRFGPGWTQKSGDRQIYEAVKANVTQQGMGLLNGHILQDHVDAAWLIAAGMPLANSIDDFLERHQANPRVKLCGKLAIARCILEAERESDLYPDADAADRIQPRIFPDAVQQSWFARLFKMLEVRITLENVASIFDDIAVINFNYDRCLEYFLVHALRASYGLPEPTAVDIVNRLRIYHPYGTVGPLAWNGVRGGVPFGGDDVRPDGLLILSKGIRTYTEEAADVETSNRIKEEMLSAQTLVFLGFGFHEPNMKLLTPPSGETSWNPRVFASAYGMSGPNTRMVTFRIENLVRAANSDNQPLVRIERDKTCFQLLDDYSLMLMKA